MKKIRVLHRSATSGAGGIDRWVTNHYKYMDKGRFQFDFITRDQNLQGLPHIREQKMKVHTFTATEYDDRELLIREISDILDIGWDVVHMHTSVWAGFLIEELAMERHIPMVIVHSHSTGVDQFLSGKRGQQTERHAFYKEQFGKQHATHFFACSQEAADWMFGSQIPRNDIRILKNAIEVENYSYDVLKREEIRRRLGVEQNFVIGHVGRYAFQKNHRFLIDVFRNLYLRNSKARLLLVGKGELEQEIAEQIREYGLEHAVLQLGWREDIHMLMQAMDCFVLPSHFEGLPVVAIEAQAAGLPCLLSDTITKEVAITENLKFLPPDEGVWQKEMERCAEGYARTNMEDKITEAGYNISNAVRELEQLYINGIRGG